MGCVESIDADTLPETGMQKGGYSSGMSSTHPRTRREDGWGTQALVVYIPSLPAKAAGRDGAPKLLRTIGISDAQHEHFGSLAVRPYNGGR